MRVFAIIIIAIAATGVLVMTGYLKTLVRYRRSKAITSLVFPNTYRVFLSPPGTQFVPRLCLRANMPERGGYPCKTEA
jgi:hypothetical protein